MLLHSQALIDTLICAKCKLETYKDNETKRVRLRVTNKNEEEVLDISYDQETESFEYGCMLVLIHFAGKFLKS